MAPTHPSPFNGNSNLSVSTSNGDSCVTTNKKPSPIPNQLRQRLQLRKSESVQSFRVCASDVSGASVEEDVLFTTTPAVTVGKRHQFAIPHQRNANATNWVEKAKAVVLAPLLLVVGSALVLGSPIIMAITLAGQTARLLVFRVLAATFLPILAWFLDTIPTWLVWIWWLRSDNISQDEKTVLEDVAMGEVHNYGPNPREIIQAIQPFRANTQRIAYVPRLRRSFSESRFMGTRETSLFLEHQLSQVNGGFSSSRHVLYMHGGGWIGANATLLMPSMTPIARMGYTVWCVNYPLAPQNKFPLAVVSVLRALHWLKQEREVTQIALIGDSAGAGLSAMACALASNRHLLEKLSASWPGQDSYAPDMLEWSFPEIIGHISMYGLLDQTAWRSNQLAQLTWLENRLSRFGLDLCYWAYGDGTDAILEGKFTICELAEELKSYPKTLAMVGNLDLLVFSSRRYAEVMNKHGFKVELREYPARHAFFGLPPALYMKPTWKNHALPAVGHVNDFLDALPFLR